MGHPLQSPPVEDREQDHRRHDKERDHCQPGMQKEKDDQDGQEPHRGLEAGGYLLGQRILDNRQVRGHTGEEFADAPAVVEVD